MGRKTFESIGHALPNRTNIVLTRDAQFTASNITVIHNWSEVLQYSEEIFIIGGEQIYKLFLPYATRLIITHICAEFPSADAFFPEIPFSQWEVVCSSHFPKNSSHAYDFDIVEYKKLEREEPKTASV